MSNEDLEETARKLAFEKLLGALEENPEYAESVRRFRESKENIEDLKNMRECKRLLDEGTAEEISGFAQKMSLHYAEDFSALAEMAPAIAAPLPSHGNPIMWMYFGREILTVILFFIPILVAARENRRDIVKRMVRSVRFGG